MNSSAKVQYQVRPPWFLLLFVSICIAGFLLWLVYFHSIGTQPGWISLMPMANCLFNSISAVCLALGYLAIKQQKPGRHAKFMLSAACSSAAFLLTYIAYHYLHGNTMFNANSSLRTLYINILASHVILSIVSLPMILGTLYLALHASFTQHKRLAKVTFPLWMYVAVTGIVVFLLLRVAG
jgi:putative membrane protein